MVEKNVLTGMSHSEDSCDRVCRVAIVMGSQSDWPIMSLCAKTLKTLHIPYEARIVSAHRTPDYLASFAKEAMQKGFQMVIAGAGGAAHLPGMIAAHTPLPVLGVPIPSRYLKGMDSLLSIVQMPKGIPVATFAIGEAGAINAALQAAAILALHDKTIAKALNDYRDNQTQAVLHDVLDDTTPHD